MFARMTRKMTKRLLAALAILAAVVGILANWEAALDGFRRLVRAISG